ncbi:uncharacterized protein LOC131879018 [Tigriopus californicus]|uniref:uncharacterized protein LOC131879018 n=1 Tax=Tigriopus californicus TaxID=6832 RepID=UPI0027DA54A6|nr:uncharacterized protein LOC131879018 [Tigriopus californicus]
MDFLAGSFEPSVPSKTQSIPLSSSAERPSTSKEEQKLQRPRRGQPPISEVFRNGNSATRQGRFLKFLPKNKANKTRPLTQLLNQVGKKQTRVFNKIQTHINNKKNNLNQVFQPNKKEFRKGRVQGQDRALAAGKERDSLPSSIKANGLKNASQPPVNRYVAPANPGKSMSNLGVSAANSQVQAPPNSYLPGPDDTNGSVAPVSSQSNQEGTVGGTLTDQPLSTSYGVFQPKPTPNAHNAPTATAVGPIYEYGSDYYDYTDFDYGTLPNAGPMTPSTSLEPPNANSDNLDYSYNNEYDYGDYPTVVPDLPSFDDGTLEEKLLAFREKSSIRFCLDENAPTSVSVPQLGIRFCLPEFSKQVFDLDVLGTLVTVSCVLELNNSPKTLSAIPFQQVPCLPQDMGSKQASESVNKNIGSGTRSPTSVPGSGKGDMTSLSPNMLGSNLRQELCLVENKNGRITVEKYSCSKAGAPEIMDLIQAFCLDDNVARILQVGEMIEPSILAPFVESKQCQANPKMQAMGPRAMIMTLQDSMKTSSDRQEMSKMMNMMKTLMAKMIMSKSPSSSNVPTAATTTTEICLVEKGRTVVAASLKCVQLDMAKDEMNDLQSNFCLDENSARVVSPGDEVDVSALAPFVKEKLCFMAKGTQPMTMSKMMTSLQEAIKTMSDRNEVIKMASMMKSLEMKGVMMKKANALKSFSTRKCASTKQFESTGQMAFEERMCLNKITKDVLEDNEILDKIVLKTCMPEGMSLKQGLMNMLGRMEESACLLGDNEVKPKDTSTKRTSSPISGFQFTFTKRACFLNETFDLNNLFVETRSCLPKLPKNQLTLTSSDLKPLFCMPEDRDFLNATPEDLIFSIPFVETYFCHEQVKEVTFPVPQMKMCLAEGTLLTDQICFPNTTMKSSVLKDYFCVRDEIDPVAALELSLVDLAPFVAPTKCLAVKHSQSSSPVLLLSQPLALNLSDPFFESRSCLNPDKLEDIGESIKEKTCLAPLDKLPATVPKTLERSFCLSKGGNPITGNLISVLPFVEESLCFKSEEKKSNEPTNEQDFMQMLMGMSSSKTSGSSDLEVRQCLDPDSNVFDFKEMMCHPKKDGSNPMAKSGIMVTCLSSQTTNVDVQSAILSDLILFTEKLICTTDEVMAMDKIKQNQRDATTSAPDTYDYDYEGDNYDYDTNDSSVANVMMMNGMVQIPKSEVRLCRKGSRSRKQSVNLELRICLDDPKAMSFKDMDDLVERLSCISQKALTTPPKNGIDSFLSDSQCYVKVKENQRNQGKKRFQTDQHLCSVQGKLERRNCFTGQAKRRANRRREIQTEELSCLPNQIKESQDFEMVKLDCIARKPLNVKLVPKKSKNQSKMNVNKMVLLNKSDADRLIKNLEEVKCKDMMLMDGFQMPVSMARQCFKQNTPMKVLSEYPFEMLECLSSTRFCLTKAFQNSLDSSIGVSTNPKMTLQTIKCLKVNGNVPKLEDHMCFAKDSIPNNVRVEDLSCLPALSGTTINAMPTFEVRKCVANQAMDEPSQRSEMDLIEQLSIDISVESQDSTDGNLEDHMEIHDQALLEDTSIDVPADEEPILGLLTTLPHLCFLNLGGFQQRQCFTSDRVPLSQDTEVLLCLQTEITNPSQLPFSNTNMPSTTICKRELMTMEQVMTMAMDMIQMNMGQQLQSMSSASAESITDMIVTAINEVIENNSDDIDMLNLMRDMRGMRRSEVRDAMTNLDVPPNMRNRISNTLLDRINDAISPVFG